jgi:hypothetical protein
VPHPAQRGGSAKSRTLVATDRTAAELREKNIARLSLASSDRTSTRVAALFDMQLRAMRRDRAARAGAELFLYDRIFQDCLERIASLGRKFERALLIGCPDPNSPKLLAKVAAEIDVRDPGPLFARAAAGETLIEDAWEPLAGGYDLVLAIGTLDTVNDLPLALKLVRYAMKAEGLFLGAFSGADTLPQLRAAMRAADSVAAIASPHAHPRIEAAAVGPLLDAAGFAGAVIDVDRIEVRYLSLEKLIADLRRMGTTNILADRSRLPLTRAAYEAAKDHFRQSARDGRTAEIFEVLHFACHAPQQS